MTGNPPIGAGSVGVTTVDRSEHYNLHLHLAIQLSDKGDDSAKYVGDETFKLVSFSGSDAISDHFQYQLELQGNTDPSGRVSPHITFDFGDLIGRPITVGINQPTKAGARGMPPSATPYTKEESCRLFRDAVTGRWPAEGAGAPEEWFSFFNGIVASFAMAEPGVYQLTVRPAAWKATLTNRYHIHPQRNIRDAIAGVLEEHGVIHNVDALSDPHNPAQYRVQDWLQAGESDYEFIQRLMGKAHIYYYYQHGPEGHTLFFANRPDYTPVHPHGHKLRYAFSSADALGMEQEDVISQYRYEKSLASGGVGGTLSRQEAAWEECTVAGVTTYPGKSDRQQKSGDYRELPFRRFQIFNYGGSDGEVEWETEQTARKISTAATGLSGAGHCARFRAGYWFEMDAPYGGQPEEVRPSLSEQPFVLTRVEHKASLDGSYSNQFQATEARGLVTPFSPQDTQQGSVLAKVVHVDNGTPPKDWKYYYKDNFDPEQSKNKDPESPTYPASRQYRPEGVYVRFVTDPEDAPARWVKLAAHMQTAPEIGVTVTVSRSYYADELPEIQSILQNNGNKTVTPCGWTASTSVGSNYSTSYGDSKSVRFGLKSAADLDRAKGIVEGEYASGQFRDSSYSQGASYSYSTSENGKYGILSKSDSFGNTYSTFKAGETKSWSEIDYSYSESTIINSDSVSTISGVANSTSTIGISNSLSTVGISDSLSTTGLQNSLATTGMSNGVSLTGMQNGLSVTGMSNNASITGMSNSFGLTGISNQVGITALSNSSSQTAVSNNTGLTGVSNNIGITGVSNSTSLTGVASSIGLTGAQSGINLTGTQSGVNLTGSVDSVNLTGSQTGINLTGSQSGINLTGSSSNIGLTGSNTGINLTGSNTGISLTGSNTGINITGSSTDISVTGSRTGISVAGSTTDISVVGSPTNIGIKGAATTIDISSGGISLSIGPKGIDLEVTALDIDLLSGLKLVI